MNNQYHGEMHKSLPCLSQILQDRVMALDYLCIMLIEKCYYFLSTAGLISRRLYGNHQYKKEICMPWLIYCKIIIIRGARIFVVFVGRSIHEFKIPWTFIPTNTSYPVFVLYITNMRRLCSDRYFVNGCIYRQIIRLVTY
jgi:hypothetical protein